MGGARAGAWGGGAVSQATLFGASPAASTTSAHQASSLDRAILRLYQQRPVPTWVETGAILDHLMRRGRLVVTSDLDRDTVTIEWAVGAHAYVTIEHPSIHQATRALVADLLREGGR